MFARGSFILMGALLCIPFADAQCPPCGPTLCTDTADYQKALAKKKVALAKEYPSRLVAILDRLGHCEKCVTTAPDGFSLLRLDTAGDIKIDAWSAENEKIGATNVSAGALKACRVIYVRKACACCAQEPAEARSDWDKQMELNTQLSVACSSS